MLLAPMLLLVARPSRAETYQGNGDTGFGGAIGNGTLTLSDDGTNISGTLTVGGSLSDVLVLYIQTGPGGFTNTSGFNDQGDGCRQAISGVSASGRSLLTLASGFQPNYAIALAPAAAGTGGLWQLANGGSNSLAYLGSVNLAPLNNSGPYTFSFPAALIGMIPGVRATIQVFGTYIRTDGYRSTEAIAGDLAGVQGWTPFSQTAYADHTFDADAVLIKMALGLWVPGAVSNSPPARFSHTAVWTGSEMIVWGGYSDIAPSNDGGRYNPVANSWTALPTTGAPAGRYYHTAVWTGSEMIVWGGRGDTSRYFNDGGRFSPAANSWTTVPTNGAPAARYGHTAVWTGSEMIAWGGYNGSSPFNNGGRYNPVANSWTAVPTTSAPFGRYSHTAVWTGSEMIVWGGRGGSFFNDGGRFNPAANSWTALPAIGALAARYAHTAIWTGSEMIVWGGYTGAGPFNSGGRYNAAGNSWTVLPTTGAPAARYSHTAVWTGSEMIVWGGGSGSSYFSDGGRFSPAANSWTALSTIGAPAGRYSHTAVWTDSEMIVWGGRSGTSPYRLNDGGRYNPTTEVWTALLVTAGPPTLRGRHTAVWTGSEMIVWGGFNGGTFFNTGGRYNPTGNSWTAVPTNGAPSGREYHTAVWTGAEMIIWGGQNSSGAYVALNDGGRYSPVANSWTALSMTDAPAARYYHTAIWTGSEMVVWGGYGTSGFLNDGGRYNPQVNSWTVVPTASAPAAREYHTAVWTGSEMIVWGGWSGSSDLSDGGRYNPEADSWIPLSSIGVAAAREYHTAIWTGTEMVVWGGCYHSGGYVYYLSNGGRYNPTADSWTTLPVTGAPTARTYHTAVWTGSEMIVWGGNNGGSFFNTGGRYNPAGNSWAGMPSAGAPDARYLHTAVWTGSEMILFGGVSTSSYFCDTWSYYPYGPAVRLSRSSPTSADVAWPVWHPTLRLCQTTNQAAGQWTAVTNPVTQVGSENHVTVSPLSGGQFFRAVYP